MTQSDLDAAAQALRDRYLSVRSRLDDAIRQSRREAASVHLVAISKFQPPEALVIVAACGQRAFGENYVQEALAKQHSVAALLHKADTQANDLGKGALAKDLEWHFTGHAQTNKAKDFGGQFALIHTLDSERLGAAIVRRQPEGSRQAVLIQVNIGEETQKSGVLPADLPALGECLAEMPGLSLQGLMCLPPRCGEGEAVRPYFAALRALRDDLALRLGLELPYLSMGMSGDFEQAVDEGATHVRIGTDIFGERPTHS